MAWIHHPKLPGQETEVPDQSVSMWSHAGWLLMDHPPVPERQPQVAAPESADSDDAAPESADATPEPADDHKASKTDTSQEDRAPAKPARTAKRSQ
jgi:hypothetical protein